MTKKLLLLLLLCLLAGTGYAQRKLQMADVYSNGMVLPRNTPFSLRGKGRPRQPVFYELAGLRDTTICNARGEWSAPVKPLPAGGPYELLVTQGRDSLRFKEVWIGEVWLCSGQSNMELTLAEAEHTAAELAAADTMRRVHFYHMRSAWPVYKQVWTAEQCDSVDRGLFILPAQWEECNAERAKAFSAIGYHFARLLADSLKCHVGIILNAVGGSTTEGWIDTTQLARRVPEIMRGNWRQNDSIMAWARQRADYNLSAMGTAPHSHPYEPGYLYRHAISTLDRYPVRGVLWYQGESNAELPHMHERLFTLLVDSWRREWQAPRMPFIFAQLSSLSTRPSWPAFRNSQRQLAQRMPAMWMTVTSDLGDSLDVHPRRKRQVAERMAAQALHHVYHLEHVPADGPRPLLLTQMPGKPTAMLRFAGGTTLQSADGAPLRGFEVKGHDGQWHTPDTVIVQGNMLYLPCSTVRRISAVRYGWQPYTDANLVDAHGLPCSTFEVALGSATMRKPGVKARTTVPPLRRATPARQPSMPHLTR